MSFFDTTGVWIFLATPLLGLFIYGLYEARNAIIAGLIEVFQKKHVVGFIALLATLGMIGSTISPLWVSKISILSVVMPAQH